MTVNARWLVRLIDSGFIPESVMYSLISKWNPTIHVDRQICRYPNFIKGVKYPEFELGPVEFNVTKLKVWLYPEQENRDVVGNKILEELVKNQMLGSCLNVADLRAIQSRGIGFFQKHFAGRTIFGWGTIVLDCHGYLYVPFLAKFLANDYNMRVELSWRCLDCTWSSRVPVLLREN